MTNIFQKALILAVMLGIATTGAEATNTTLPTLSAGSAVSAGDLLLTRQGADTADKSITAAQLKTFMSASPTLVTPALGTIASGVGTNLTGTAAGLTAGAVTNGIYTTDTGTVTNTMLAGSIANAKLSNPATTVNGQTCTLGSTCTITSTTNANTTGDVTGIGNVTSFTGTKNYYVTNPTYGAKCDVRYLTDVTTTASSATISSASYNFVAGDVGKNIAVWASTQVSTTGTWASGATTVTSLGTTTNVLRGMLVTGTNIPNNTRVLGIAGTSVTLSQVTTGIGTAAAIKFTAPVNTTISSISGTSAVLAVTMTVSVAGNAPSIFGTDDTAAIQAAVTAAHNATPAGGNIIFPYGMCAVSSTLTTYGQVSYSGQGAGSGLVYLSASDQNTAVILGYSGGSCTYAIGLTYADMRFSNFEIDASASTLTGGYHVGAKGINVGCSVRSMFDHMYIHDTPATCIASDQGMPTTISNNVVVNCGRLGSGQAGSNGIGEGTSNLPQEAYDVTGNIVINAQNYGILFEPQTAATSAVSINATGNVIVEQTISTTSAARGGISDGDVGAVISGNKIYGPNVSASNWNGIQIGPGTLTLAGATETNVSGNTIDNVHIGINIALSAVSALPTSLADKYLISNNEITNSNSYGIILNGNGTTAENGLKISNNYITLSGNAGIYMTGTASAKNVQINDNIIANNGLTGAAGQQSGIDVNMPIAGFMLENNLFYDDNTSTEKYGLYITTGQAITKADVHGNNFSDVITQAINPVGTITGNVNNNIGMNVPTLSGCSATSPTGNGDIGTYTSGTTGACTTTITPYGSSNIIANNGYICYAFDKTTLADIVQTQSAYTTTSATITGTTLTSDVVAFTCRMF